MCEAVDELELFLCRAVSFGDDISVSLSILVSLTQEFEDVSATMLYSGYNDMKTHTLLELHLRQSDEIMQKNLAEALQEKRCLESEVKKAEIQRDMKNRQLQDARRLVRQERIQNKLAKRQNQKMRQELEVYLNEMPMNYKKETLAKLAHQVAQSQVSVSSDSNIEVEMSTDSYSSSSLASSVSSPTTVQTEDSDMEQAFSKRISSSTESDRSSIHLFSNMLGALKKRQHTLKERCFMLGNKCVVCQKKFVCGRMELVCEDCKASVHGRCRDRLALPCIPTRKLNPRKMLSRTVADFCVPGFRPQIPALIIHSIMIIEMNGLNQKGLYVFPDYSHETEMLKQQLDNETCVPNLARLKTNTVCELLKHFLSTTVKTSLIGDTLYEEFERLQITKKNSQEDIPKLYDIMMKISEAERATLSFLFLHLKKVCESPECKVSPNCMAKTFAPLLIRNFNRDDAFNEKKKKYLVIQKLISIPENYYECILKDLF